MRVRARSFALVLIALLAVLGASGCAKRKRVAMPAQQPAVTPDTGSSETGIASWYGAPYHGRRSANGEIYDMEQMTAAHRTLRFGTWVSVTNLANNQSVGVRITDRGPFVDGRIIDLSRAAARSIGMLGSGIANVRIGVIEPPRETPPPEPAIAEAHFAVQVGAFRNRDSAERMRQDFEQRFGSARLVLRDGNPPLWRVVVGDESTFDGAASLAERIRTDQTPALVVRADP